MDAEESRHDMLTAIKSHREILLGLSLLYLSGCSNSQTYNTVSSDFQRRDVAAAINRQRSARKSGAQLVAQSTKPQPQQIQREASKSSTDPATPGAIRLVEHTVTKSSPVRRTSASQPQHVAPPVSALQLARLEKNRSPIGTRPETPALIFTTLPPKAEGDVAELLAQVRSGNAATCREAIYQLGRRGPAAAAAAPTLTVMLRDRDHMIRVHAALALWRITERPEFSVPTLADAINFSTGGAKSFSAVALAEMGPAAKQAIPALKIATRKNSGKIRVQAAEALWSVSKGNQDALQTLAIALRDSDPEVRWAAAYSLGELAPNNRMVIEALARRLRDVNDGVRVAAAFALGEIGPSAKQAETVLTAAAQDPNHDVRQAAAVALKRVRR